MVQHPAVYESQVHHGSLCVGETGSDSGTSPHDQIYQSLPERETAPWNDANTHFSVSHMKGAVHAQERIDAGHQSLWIWNDRYPCEICEEIARAPNVPLGLFWMHLGHHVASPLSGHHHGIVFGLATSAQA